MKEQSPWLFKTAEIREQNGLRLKLKPEIASFADAFETPQTLKAITVELHFTPMEGEILLQGRVEVELNLNCARCDAPVTGSFADSFDELYPDTLEYIDTLEPVRETAGLLAPLKTLCSESCKGRCDVCGGDRNRKPCDCKTEKATPFSALKDFKPAKGRQEPPNGKKPGGSSSSDSKR